MLEPISNAVLAHSIAINADMKATNGYYVIPVFSYLRLMPDFVGTILMVLFWIFIVRGITKFIKSATGKTEKDPKAPATTQKPQAQSFQDIFREMQRKIQEAEEQQNLPPYAEKHATDIKQVKETVKETVKVKDPVLAEKRSTSYRQKTILTEKERKLISDQKDLEGEIQREKMDSAEKARIKKIYAIDAIEEETSNIDFDLRNAIIGKIILDRPYS